MPNETPTSTGTSTFTGPLFIVGAARSGTKLLRDLVRQHPDVGIPLYETEFLPRLLSEAHRFEPLSDRANFARFYAWATRFMYFRYMADDGTLVGEQAWYDACPGFDVAGVFEGLCRHDGGAPVQGVWGDKSPNYRNHLPELAALYPQARFVHIVRDGRDVALSSHKAWGKHVLRNGQRWADEVGACRRAGQALGPSRYHELRYEDLIESPEPALRAIAAFIERPFVAAMTNPGRASENLGDTRGATRVVAGNREKWRSAMSPEQLRRFEAVAGGLLSELGYPLAFEPQPPARVDAVRMGLYRLHDGAELLRFRVKDWGVRDAVRYSVSAWQSTRTG